MGLPARIGRFNVELQLGQGGTGRVLLGRDTALGRQVALRILRDDLGVTPEVWAQLAERMRQEARAAATLSHPAMIALHDLGEDERMGPYLVLELIKGMTLRERLQRGPLAPAEVAQLARTLGSVLTHAHSAGVFHRGVKPENVILAPMGARLADFGTVRPPDSRLTATMLGTPAYTAPEAIASASFSAHSDEFSLAATLYEALTGVRPFPGTDPLAVAMQIATSVHAPPTSLVASLRSFVHLDAIFDRALAKDANNRFPSCEGFAAVLAAELESKRSAYIQTPSSSPAPSRSSIVPRATRRWQNGIALLALGVIVALIGLGRFHHASDGTSSGGVGEGLSLRSVASAFATVAMQRVGAPSPARHARPIAPAAISSANSGGPSPTAFPSASGSVGPAPPVSSSGP